MGYSVFLSHNTIDQKWVEQIEQSLWRNKIRPYLFQRDPLPGESISKKIANAISNSDALVVLITKKGQFSKWLNAEIGYAKAADIPIIPMVDSTIENPELPFLGDADYIKVDLKDFEHVLPVLIKDLSKRKFKKRLFWEVVIGGFLYFIIRDKFFQKNSKT